MKTIKRKTLLYKSNVEFEDYALNHVEGCTHNCKYPCYARLMKKKTEKEWIDIAIVENAIKLLDEEIKSLKDKIKQVHLCFSTDLFMYKQPEVINLSLQIIKKLSDNNIKVKTLTKGEIPSDKIVEIENSRLLKVEDDLFATREDNVINEYGITITSLNENYRVRYEPDTAPFELRIRSLKELSDNKLYTYVYCEPFSPAMTSIVEFKKLLNEIKFIKKIYFGSWQYNEKFSNKSTYKEYINYLVDFCKDNNIEVKLKKEIAYLRYDSKGI